MHVEDVRWFTSRLMEYIIHILIHGNRSKSSCSICQIPYTHRPDNACLCYLVLVHREAAVVQNDRRMEDAGSGVLDSGMTNNGRQQLPMTADLMAGIFLVASTAAACTSR